MGIDVFNILKEEGFNVKLYKRTSIWSVKILTRYEMEKLYNYLYSNCSFCMERKKEKFKELISKINNDRPIQTPIHDMPA